MDCLQFSQSRTMKIGRVVLVQVLHFGEVLGTFGRHVEFGEGIAFHQVVYDSLCFGE